MNADEEISEEEIRKLVNDLGESPNRAKILGYLYNQRDVRITTIANRTRLTSSTTHYHCDVLKKVNLIETWIQETTKKRYAHITNNGRIVWEKYRSYKKEEEKSN